MTREREYFFGEDRMGGGGRGGGMGGGGRGGGPMGGGRGGGGFMHKSVMVKALKETMQSGHRTGLTGKVLEYFTPRPQLPPCIPLKKKKHPVPFTGVAQYVSLFAGPQDPEEVKAETKPRLFKNPELALQCRLTTETKAEKQIRLSEWKIEESERLAAEAAKSWDPHKDSRIEGDPFRTLFVSRLSFEVTEKKLKREFEEFGPVRRVRIVTDKSGKSRGYGFVEFEDKKDMKEAYKMGDGRKIEGRRVLVDVERGRTVESWKPRRLAGGLGGEGRIAKPPKKGAPVLVAPPPSIDDRPRIDARGPPPPPRERSPVRVDRDRDRERDRERERERERERGDRDRDRKREREPSPRRERGGDDTKRRREVEEGEVREDRPRDRGDRGGDRDRERERDGRSSERDRPDRKRDRE